MLRQQYSKGCDRKKALEPAERRALVDYIKERFTITISRACRLMDLSRSVYRYRGEKRNDDKIRKELAALAEKHPRYGFRKMFRKIKQHKYQWNHKRVYRVYCEMKLNLKRKPKKRIPSRKKVVLVHPEQPNMCWSLDYMSDSLVSGRKFRTANVIDDFNREVLNIRAASSLPARNVAQILDEVAEERGYPLKLRVDNGPENRAKALQEWAAQRDVELEYIEPGKPAQNGYVERFNRTYREEILDMNLFQNIQEVQYITDQWIVDFNNHRPHESLGNLTPAEYAIKHSTFKLY